MNRENSTKSLAEAGLLTALTVVIVLFVYFMPLLGVAGVVILPIPIAVLYLKYGFRLAVTSTIGSLIIVSVILGPMTGISMSTLFGLTGLALGYSFKKNLKVSTSILILSVASIVGFSISIFVNLIFVDKNMFVNLLDSTIKQFKESFELSIKMSGATANTEQMRLLQEQMDRITPEMMLSLLPGGLVIYAFAGAVINYNVTRKILKRLRFEVRESVSFDRFYIDNRIGALIIILTCLGIILNQRNVPGADYILNSSQVIMSLTFTLVGSAVVYNYVMKKMRIGKTAAIVILVFAVFSRMSVLIFYIGLADMIFDFRKVDPNRLFKVKKGQ